MNPVETIKLIHVDPIKNNNKWWTGILYDNGTVETKWGRVGHAGDSKMFPNAGSGFLYKKRSEKEKKGYTSLKTLDGDIFTAKTVAVSNVASVAIQQISKGKSPFLDSFIARLASENIHNIVSNTNITYNSTTGLFTTPLGIVTPDAIIEARSLLFDLKNDWQKKTNNGLFLQNLGKYMRLIPQNVGMKLRVESIFPDQAAFDKQSDILDSLEASYATAIKTPPKTTQKDGDTVEKIFDVELDILNDKGEFDRICDKYVKTRKDGHVCRHLKVKNIYTIKINHMYDAWVKRGATMTNKMELWHGTKTANLLSILKNGLMATPPKTAQITGKLYGNGIYFAIHSTKSLNYCVAPKTKILMDDLRWVKASELKMGDGLLAFDENRSIGGHGRKTSRRWKRGVCHECGARRSTMFRNHV